jgi:hypothetical protein
MSESSKKVREPKAKDGVDQALNGTHIILRKPLKLTATLKRRALKIKACKESKVSSVLDSVPQERNDFAVTVTSQFL